jgi:hypothetical protein
VGLYIALERENGEEEAGVPDVHNLLRTLLPQEDGSLLSGIDWYGDTTFNGQQMKPFLTEWQRLRRSATRPDESLLLDAIESLALRCRDGVHLCLKFVGD